MKFTVEKNVVLNAVKKVGSLTASRAAIPVLSQIRFSANAENKKVTLTSTNLEMRLECSFEADVAKEGIMMIPGRKLISVLSAMTGTGVEFDGDTEKFHTTIKCGKSKVKLLGLSPADFPEEETFTANCMFSIPMEKFQRLIKDSSYYVATDNTRKALCGIYLETDENKTLHLVSTNGKSLAYASTEVEEFIQEKKNFCIVPVPVVNAIVSAGKCDNVSFGFNDKRISALAGDIVLTAKLIEGNYPNFRSITKEKFEHSCVLPVAETIAKLSLLNAVIQSVSPVVVLEIQGDNIRFSAESAESGAVDDEMALFEGSGDEKFTIQLNPLLLAQCFEAHKTEEKAVLNFDSEMMPVQFSFENSQAVIMPIRPKTNNQQ